MNNVDLQTTVKQLPSGGLYVEVESSKYYISSTAQNVALDDKAEIYALSNVTGSLWFLTNATHTFASRCPMEFIFKKES